MLEGRLVGAGSEPPIRGKLLAVTPVAMVLALLAGDHGAARFAAATSFLFVGGLALVGWKWTVKRRVFVTIQAEPGAGTIRVLSNG